MECMRDHAAEVYRVETGRPYSPTRGSRVSRGVTASMIDARNYLAERARERREQFAPEGPVVAFSGGQIWDDHEMLWRGLDSIKARVPEMILATTAQTKGCDAIAQAWAAARGGKDILFRTDRRLGGERTEERRGGKGGVSTCRAGWRPSASKKTKKHIKT